MRYDFFINEAKTLSDTMIGFLAKSSDFKRTADYIQSWLDRFDIDYDRINAPHFSIAQITSSEKKDDMVRQIDLIEGPIKFTPKDLEVLEGREKDFIVIAYKPNNEFVSIFKELSGKYEVKWFGELKPHISLFSVPKATIKKKLFDNIEFSLPILPKVKTTSIGLWNKRFQLEYERNL